MNFDTIVTNVEQYLIDLPSETTALIPTWVNLAIRHAEKKHNYFHMQKLLEVVTTINVRELADYPAGYKAGRSDPWREADDGGVVEFDWAPSRSDMNRQYNNSATVDIGAPEFILEVVDEDEGVEEIWAYPYPDGQSDYTDGEYRIKIPYWGFTADLSGSENNFITNNGELYVIYRATHYGMLFNRDERAGDFLQLSTQELRDLQQQDKRGRTKRRNELTVSTRANSASKFPRRNLGFGNRRGI